MPLIVEEAEKFFVEDIAASSERFYYLPGLRKLRIVLNAIFGKREKLCAA